MLPRQIQEVFRIIGHTVATNDSNLKGKLPWCMGVGVILMAALKVAEPRMYRRIGKAEVTPEDVGKFLITLLGRKMAIWWFCIYVTGRENGEDEKGTVFANLFRNLGFIEAEASFDAQKALGRVFKLG